jgi:flagellar motor switch protein FliN
VTASIAIAPSRLADAFASALPFPAAQARPSTAAAVPPAVLGGAVITAFVGATPAELAVALLDPEGLGHGDERLTPSVVLRPALDAAALPLGAGVLQDPRTGDASALFADPSTQVFELRSSGAVVGWLAVQLSARVSAAPALDAASVTERLSRISNVEMTLTVEIGRTRIPVRSVLGLEAGAVIELDRPAGAPADILLNGRPIALGEIVVVDQDYAVRITRILDAEGIA